MNTAIIDNVPTLRGESLLARINRILANRFVEKRETAELQRLTELPPYLVADIGLPGLHQMSPDARRDAYRSATRQAPEL
jgi:hypothetical protein